MSKTLSKTESRKLLYGLAERFFACPSETQEKVLAQMLEYAQSDDEKSKAFWRRTHDAFKAEIEREDKSNENM